MLLLERVEQQVSAARLLAASVGGDLPDVGAAREQFLTILASDPEKVDPAREDWLLAMGLR